MLATKEHALRERAYFIAGKPARDRDRSPVVESAIGDAITYLDALPKNVDEPTLSGGKRTDIESIITLHWLVQTSGHVKIKAVTLAFLGHGICSARWPDRFGKEREVKPITVAEALALKLPEKVRDLRSRFDGPKTPEVR
jgi:hypothetical protein